MGKDTGIEALKKEDNVHATDLLRIIIWIPLIDVSRLYSTDNENKN